jgi:7,8-dihydropterin-6-yl-methyl-4-(beta-D-ribofuranosyl)aminobenzene 5'-phosphate synthase
VQIAQQTEVLPGFFLMSNRSSNPGTIEMNEISLAFRTPKGAILVVGCSHPGIENIVEATTKIDPHIYTVFGGFHLLGTPDDKVTATIVAFRDKWRIERMGAGHCTGQFAFAELVRIYGPNFDIAGIGSVISLPV